MPKSLDFDAKKGDTRIKGGSYQRVARNGKHDAEVLRIERGYLG